jgi:hypothetical protein
VEIHDTVLIAAAFSMFNRYVDGLSTEAPEDPNAYATAAEHIVVVGYAADTDGTGPQTPTADGTTQA